MNQNLPASIRAQLHDDAIEKVTRFFNATTTETLTELFQNCRRAGARQIDVAIADGFVTVCDDGHGITDPAVLLEFGHSDWGEKTRELEDPAGMGMYALARHQGVRVRSRPRAGDNGRNAPPGFEVNLDADHFLGRKAATVVRLPEGAHPCGTTVRFQDADASRMDVETAAAFLPLQVRCNEEEVPGHDFLANAVHLEYWRGIRIGIQKDRYSAVNNSQMNVHGIVIGTAGLPSAASLDAIWTAKADMFDCSEIELVLPRRTEVIESGFLNELRTECLKAIYRAMLKDPEEVEVRWKVHENARTHGIELPAARPRLRAWRPGTADESSKRAEVCDRTTIPTDAIVMTPAMSSSEEIALWRAIRNAESTAPLYHEDREMAGYPWYESLRRAQKLRIDYRHQHPDSDGQAALQTLPRTLEKPDGRRPGSITFTLTIRKPDGSSETLAIDGDVAFGHDECGQYRIENLDVLVTADSTVDPDTLGELIEDAFFYFDDDCEADSYDTQLRDFQEEAAKRALALLATPQEALLRSVERTVYDRLMPCLPPNQALTVEIDKDGSATITLKAPKPQEPAANV